jgi:delta-60 repeat domain
MGECAVRARDGGIVTHRRQRVLQSVLAVSVAAVGLVPASGVGAWPGDPDGSFGACGTLGIDVVPGAPSAARAASLAADGKVLVAGYADDRGLVMRLDAGLADPTFGTLGRTRIGYTGVGRYLAIAPTAAGGAVAAGSRTDGTAIDTAVVRLKPNGALDPTFHGNGKLTFDVGGTDSARAVAALSDGSVLVAGNANAGGFVERTTATGTPDTTWDGDGRTTGLAMEIRSLATRADGSVYIAGATLTTPADWRIIRLAPDGTVDTAFGGANGITVDAGGHDSIAAIAVQPDGKVLAAGFGNGAAGHGQTLVRRYLDDGSADPSFTPFHDAFGVNDSPTALARQADGRVVVAVNSKVGTDNDLVLVRLGDDGVPDDSFGVGGVSISDSARHSSVNGVVVPSGGGPFAVGSLRLGANDIVGMFRYQPDSSTFGVPTQGVEVDGYGGLHGWSSGCTAKPGGFVGASYWPGWDIVRGVAVVPGNGGLTVDAYGGLHGFKFGDGSAPTTSGAPYWSGWDIVRGVAVVPEGTGGFELDAFGGLHPFSIRGGPMPVAPPGAPYWPGFDAARGVALTPDGLGGYIVVSTGAIYAFGNAPAPNAGGPSWPGQDIARGIALSPDGSGGWVSDLFGGLHPFGTGGDSPPAATVGGPYWPGFAIARGAAALP